MQGGKAMKHAAADGKSGGTGAYKWVFKGYSPATRCCQGK